MAFTRRPSESYSKFRSLPKRSRKVPVGDDAHGASLRPEFDQVRDAAARGRSEVVALVGVGHGREQTAADRDELRKRRMHEVSVLRSRQNLEPVLGVGETGLDAVHGDRGRDLAGVGDDDEVDAELRDGLESRVAVGELGARPGGGGHLHEPGARVDEAPADLALASADDPVAASRIARGDVRLPVGITPRIAVNLHGTKRRHVCHCPFRI